MIALLIPIALTVFCGVAMVTDLQALEKQIRENERKIKNGV